MSSYASGTINAVNGSIGSMTQTSNGAYAFQVSGVGTNILVAETSLDYVTWYPMSVVASTFSSSPNLAQTTITADGFYYIPVTGGYFLRVRCSTYTGGTISGIVLGTDTSGISLGDNVYIQSPVDGGGSVKVSQQGPISANATIVNPIDGLGNVKVAQQGPVTITGPSGGAVSPSNYTNVPGGSGGATTVIKNSAGVLYGIYLAGASLLGTVTVKDGSNIVLPSGLLGSTLAAAPFAAVFPNGIAFNSNITVVTAGVTNAALTVLWR